MAEIMQKLTLYFQYPFVWYALIVVTLAYYFFFDIPRFKQVQIFILITQIIAMTCYVLFPSRQDLRPETFARDNFLTRLMAFIYSFDTSTGVCPSLHVAYSIGIAEPRKYLSVTCRIYV